MKRMLICIILIASGIRGNAQTIEHTFEVSFKGNVIGNLFALEQHNQKGIVRDLRTNTFIDLMAFSVHVESEVKILKKEERLILSSCYRHANRGAEEILAQIKKVGPQQYDVIRNGKEFKLEGRDITYCTVDLYFNEPDGIKEVFSSMFAEFLKLEKIKSNKYKLISPKSKDSYYTYDKGVLTLVEIDTPLGLTSCKRIK